MKLIKLSLLVVVAAVVIIIYRISPTLHLGQNITDYNNDLCRVVPSAAGAEDITIDGSKDLAFFAADERRQYIKRGVNVDQNGTLWSLDLANNDSTPLQIQTDFKGIFHPHGIALFTDSESRNFIYVVNHVNTTEHEINVFELISPTQASFVTTHSFPELTSPNDLYVVDHHTFYVTNDHKSPRHSMGEKLEDLLRLPESNVVFFNGASAQIVIEDLYMANGITLNADNSKLYVAESTANQIREFQMNEQSRWTPTKTLPLSFMPDNLEWDDAGNLLTAGHPKAIDFMLHTFDEEQLAPSIASRINVQTGEVETLFQDIGDDLSASSVAAIHENQMLIGSVFEPKFLRCNLIAEN
jgi:arylesterase / paraoxonase